MFDSENLDEMFVDEISSDCTGNENELNFQINLHIRESSSSRKSSSSKKSKKQFISEK